MPRQLNFTAGELAPSLYGRVDQSRYAAGLRTCRNGMVMRHGGIQNRPGTSLVAEVKDSTSVVRLIPFIFNPSQTYVLEFGNLYMRVHRNGAPIRETATTITGVTQASPGVVTTSAPHGYSDGEDVFISGIVGMVELNNRTFRVRNPGASTFELEYLDNGAAVDTSGFTAYSSGGTAERVFEIVTPYTSAQLAALQYVQSADVVTLVHPSHAPRDLARTGDTAWTLTTMVFAPTIGTPTNPAVTGGAGTAAFYVITTTSNQAGGFEESLPSVQVGVDSVPDIDNPRTITWDQIANAQEYNVYRSRNGIFGFIGLAGDSATPSFVDDGINPDTTDSPPIDPDVFGSGENPAVVAYSQGQRLFFANLPSSPETIHASQVALRRNFTISLPLKDDDAISFTLQGRQVNSIRHLMEVNGTLIGFTESGEFTIEGDQDKVLKPDAIFIVQQTFNGATANLPPLNVGGNALYVQARGNIVRDLGFDVAADGYRGNDLTVFSPHLFEGFSLSEWAYQQQPHSIVWIVRSDGTLLGLTYLREHAIVGWHRHDTPAASGLFESVTVVPESGEDVPYFVVNRTINSQTRRYIERMESRRVSESTIKDAIIMDSTLTFDGRNIGSDTMTLTGGPPWTAQENLTLTSSVAFFEAADVGNEIQYLESATGDGEPLRLEIVAFTSPTVVTVRPHRDVPASVQGVAVTAWAEAVDTLLGLEHLNLENVSVFADGFVVGSPNNPGVDAIQVTLDSARRGTITLEQPFAVIHVGLPYVTDFEPLDLDTPQEGLTVMDKEKIITRAAVRLEASRGLFVGGSPPDNDSGSLATENLREPKIRGRFEDREDYDDPVRLFTDVVEVDFPNSWNSNGRFFIRQVDPLPMAILSVNPMGMLPQPST